MYALLVYLTSNKVLLKRSSIILDKILVFHVTLILVMCP